MEIKDYILITISATALGISLLSLVITLIQKYRETNRNIRKSLTDTLESISKIGIETLKLKSSLSTEEYGSEKTIQLRRTFNSQRRILIANADYLVRKNNSIVTEIDCNLLASAYNTIGDIEKAENYWKKTIKKSNSNPIRHMNLRGFGIFLFEIGKIQEAREKFSEALQIKLLENDSNKNLIADTYLMLSDAENDYGDKVLAQNYLTKCMEFWSDIKNLGRKNEIYERIHNRVKA